MTKPELVLFPKKLQKDFKNIYEKRDIFNTTKFLNLFYQWYSMRASKIRFDQDQLQNKHTSH